jgi:hypothetical protein
MYCAEVYLSLDAAADGEAFFRKQKESSKDPARLSSAIVLGQILLLENKHAEYATLTTDTVAPLLFNSLKDRPAASTPESDDSMQHLVMELLTGSALTPLTTPEFVAGLPEKEVGKLLPRWEALDKKAKTAVSRRMIDAVVETGHKRLGD